MTEYIANKLPDDFFSIEQENMPTVFQEIYEQVSSLVQQGHDIPKIQTPHRVRANP